MRIVRINLGYGAFLRLPLFAALLLLLGLRYDVNLVALGAAQRN